MTTIRSTPQAASIRHAGSRAAPVATAAAASESKPAGWKPGGRARSLTPTQVAASEWKTPAGKLAALENLLNSDDAQLVRKHLAESKYDMVDLMVAKHGEQDMTYVLSLTKEGLKLYNTDNGFAFLQGQEEPLQPRKYVLFGRRETNPALGHIDLEFARKQLGIAAETLRGNNVCGWGIFNTQAGGKGD